MDYANLKDWFFAHDWQMLLVTTYVLLNVGPRPHPENLTGYKKVFWLIVDRLAWLSAEKVPGDWKWIFAESPLPGAPAAAAAAPAPPSAVEARTEEDPPAVAQDPPKDPPPAA